MRYPKLNKGQLVICIHYRDRPLVKVDRVRGTEVWVTEPRQYGFKSWWGPRSWFKTLPPEKKKKKNK